MSQSSFVVTFDRENVSKEETAEYIKVAVRQWAKGGALTDPFFGLQDVKVEPVRESSWTDERKEKLKASQAARRAKRVKNLRRDIEDALREAGGALIRCGKCKRIIARGWACRHCKWKES